MNRLDRYDLFAPLYDLISGEQLIYHAGRVRGVKDLQLQAGMTVLDLGCGTGLNFDLLEKVLGPTGRIIGLDKSQAMLRQARQLTDRNGWPNVTLVLADATAVTAENLKLLIAAQGVSGPIDAVIATYALSVMADPGAAWITVVGLCGPGTRVCIVDMQRPIGVARLLTPLARLACALGGADIEAHPWVALEHQADDVSTASLRGGHIQVRTGSLRPEAR